MAITLDELLGRSTVEKQTAKEVGNFPAYESWNRRQDNQTNSSDIRSEFSQNSARGTYANGNDYNVESNTRGYENRGYNARVDNSRMNSLDARIDSNSRGGLDTRIDNNRMSSLDTRTDNNSRGGFDARIDNNSRAGFDARIDNSRMSNFDTRVDSGSRAYEQYKNVADTSRTSAIDRMNMYEFTASDCDRLADDALYEKLSHTNSSRKPLFDKDAMAANAQTNKTFFASKEAKNEETKKHRGKLNTKGKVILGVYIAVIVTIAVLIIVNAGSLNNGTAKTPSSSISRSIVIDR